jgi:hypothetical protein
MRDGRDMQILKSTGVGIILASNLFLFVPLTLYVASSTEFSV